jgi:hypothetical protein
MAHDVQLISEGKSIALVRYETPSLRQRNAKYV